MNIPSESVLGVNFAKVTERSVVEQALRRVSQGQGTWICPVNLDVLRQIAADPTIRALVGTADIIVADGMPILWAAQLQGGHLPERIAGSHLIRTLSRAAGLDGRSIYLLGGNDGVAEAAGHLLAQETPGLQVAGSHCPPFGFELSADGREKVATSLELASPDIVFVGLGFPKQDKLIVEMRSRFPRALFVSCGISFSMITGQIIQAPRAIQRHGLEWTYRLAQEPRRLARRYLLLGVPFAARLAALSIRERFT